MRVWFWLLIVLIGGGLGSLSLAPHVLALESLTGGECSAAAGSINYVTQDNGAAQGVPATWYGAGHDEQDLAVAQACAASFVIAYQSFDAGVPKTLETSVTLLTAGAQDRFYGRVAGVGADQHMSPQWRAYYQRQQQTARAGKPEVLDAHYVNGRFLVWMKTPYQIFVQNGAIRSFQQGTLTVLLVAVPAGVRHQGTGWQVAGWQGGETIFVAPTPL